MSVEYDCAICGNKGIIEVETEFNGRKYPAVKFCDCQKIRASLESLERSGLKDAVKQFTFENFETRFSYQKTVKGGALKFVEDILSGQYSWFAAIGRSGSGKTHICTAICNRLIKSGFKVKYFRWAEESKRLKTIVNEPEYAEEMRVLFSNDVIYIDDLFKRKKDEYKPNGDLKQSYTPTDGDIKLAFEIFDTAIFKKKILIISGEDTLDSLNDIDAAIAGRINRQAQGNVIVLNSESVKNYRFTDEGSRKLIDILNEVTP